MRYKTALVGVLLGAGAASGGTVYTDSQVVFLSTVGSGVGPVVDFNGLAPTDSYNNHETESGAVSGNFNDFTYSVATVLGLGNGMSSRLGVMYESSSPEDQFLVGNQLNDPQTYGLRVDFTGGVTAVGANLFRYQQSGLTDGFAIEGWMWVEFRDTADELIGVRHYVNSGGRDTFLGFTSDVAIGSMFIHSDLIGANWTRYVALDNLYFGTATVVPLPPAAWAGLGLLGVIGGLRAARRRG